MSVAPDFSVFAQEIVLRDSLFNIIILVIRKNLWRFPTDGVKGKYISYFCIFLPNKK